MASKRKIGVYRLANVEMRMVLFCGCGRSYFFQFALPCAHSLRIHSFSRHVVCFAHTSPNGATDAIADGRPSVFDLPRLATSAQPGPATQHTTQAAGQAGTT